MNSLRSFFITLRSYPLVVAVSFVIALPVAVYAVHEWLSNFAYKTDVHLWIFIAVFFVVSTMSMLVVTLTSWRTVARNPVEVLNK